MSNNQNSNDEQLYIPEALHMMMMQIEAARIECNRMQAEIQSGRANDFLDTYNQQPALPPVAVKRETKSEGSVIYAAHRFMGRTAGYMHACLAFFIAMV